MSKIKGSNRQRFLKQNWKIIWIRLQNFFDPTVRLFKPEDNLASPFVFPEIMRFQTSFVKIGLENYLRTVALSLRTYRLLVYPKERTKGRIFYDFDRINWLKDRFCIKLLVLRQHPRTSLQCFALYKLCSRAKQCRDVLGRCLRTKN